MIIAISQPTFVPWLGYFDIIKKSDIFVFLDNVKFEKRSWQMRNKIKMSINNKEEEEWIRIPTKSGSNAIIKDVLIDNTQKWREEHLKKFSSYYGKDFEKNNFLNEIYEKKWEKLVDFNIEFIEKCCNYLGIKTKFRRASELNSQGKKSELLLNICLEMKSCQYLSTIGAKEYLDKDKEMFESKNIEIIYHEYDHPKYKQKGKRFIEKLSILDLPILNEDLI